MENQGKSLTPVVTPVNGTKEPTDWQSVDWRKAEREIIRLRQRIFRAASEGDLKKVRSLQKLMLRSYANRLVSVRRVTQINKGKKTPGVDKLTALTPKSRGMLVDKFTRISPWKAEPARRVYIPKANGKKRPLGIPMIFDSCLQAMVKNALEPFWESKFEATSYGFRPGRRCQDAAEKIFKTAAGNRTRKWVLDADIKGAFDHIGHERLLEAIGAFPARELIRQWLKAGYVEMGMYHDTDEGTPQGGVISPLLANIALHGMEEALGVTRTTKRCKGKQYETIARGCPVVVRYADDFVVLTEKKEEAEAARRTLTEWLAVRGLALNEEKTRIAHITEGFDFLSFHFQQHPRKNRGSGYKLLVTPSREAVKRHRDRMRTEWRSLKGKPPAVAIGKLNPIIRGWANYHRHNCARRAFGGLDDWMYWREMSYLRHTFPSKPKKWYRQKGYFGSFLRDRQDNGTFHDRKAGKFLWKYRWIAIERHTLVTGTSSPDDPALKGYWEARRMKKAKSLGNRQWRHLAVKQKGLCPRCGLSVLEGEDAGSIISTTEQVDRHHKIPRQQGGSNDWSNLELVHKTCHHQHHAGRSKIALEEEDTLNV